MTTPIIFWAFMLIIHTNLVAFKQSNQCSNVSHFDQSMMLDRFSASIDITWRAVGIPGNQLYSFFKKLYEKNNSISVHYEVKIPKIIHHIWLGGDVPEVFKSLIATWKEHHSGDEWQHIMWTDKDVAPFGMYNKKYYDETDSVGVKSDLLKWEIIYRHGGLYVDVDFECLRSIESLHYLYDFYTGIQPLDTQFLQLGAALFAAIPGHPILKHCIETVKDDWHKRGAPTKTGPIHFTKSFYAKAGKENLKDIAFPAGYFYPLGCQDTQLKKNEWVNSGVYAVHHWAKSWMPSDYRLTQFKELNNDHSVITWNH